MTLYQKYRAKKFSEVISQSHITGILQSGLKLNDFGHSYLFYGTRGSGKTSISRIFARALNCQSFENLKDKGEPCNECESCLSSLRGAHPDIIELDAASNRGIDDVRSLKDDANFVPNIGKYKVYIIDEAHMMTKEAFNALLKIIEEPPKHVVFILCTTEIYKVPSTILSRSQVFEFKNASVNELTHKIDRILECEGGVSLDYDAKKFVARLGKGSFRDMESILETILSASVDDKLIGVDKVIEIIGFNTLTLVRDIKKAMVEGDVKCIQRVVEGQVDDGKVIALNKQLIEELYHDITDCIREDKEYKNELFILDILIGIESELKSSLSPKYLFLTKLLKEIVYQNDKVEFKKEARENKSNDKLQKDDLEAKDVAETNEVGVSEESDFEVESGDMDEPYVSEGVVEDVKDKKKSVVDKESKLKSIKIKEELCAYLMGKNRFLGNVLMNSFVSLDGDRLSIKVRRKMEEDMLNKKDTKEVIREFLSNKGVGQSIVVSRGEVESNMAEKGQNKKNDVGDLEDVIKRHGI